MGGEFFVLLLWRRTWYRTGNLICPENKVPLYGGVSRSDGVVLVSKYSYSLTTSLCGHSSKGGELGFVTKIKNAQNYGRKSTILYVNKDDSIVAVAFVRLPFYAQSQ